MSELRIQWFESNHVSGCYELPPLYLYHSPSIHEVKVCGLKLPLFLVLRVMPSEGKALLWFLAPRNPMGLLS